MVKNPPVNAGDTSSILGLGRFPGEEIGSLLKYSCLGYPKDKKSYSQWSRKRVGYYSATKQSLYD